MINVAILEDNEGLRESLKKVISLNPNTTVLTAASFKELQSHEVSVRQCDLAILDVNLGHEEPTGIDAYHWLKAIDFSGTVIFLTGHACNNPLLKDISDLDSIEIHQKPMHIKTLLEKVASCKS